MKRYLPIILLILTMTSRLSVAADPAAQASPVSSLDQLGLGTDSQRIQAIIANNSQPADPGYTQIGSLVKLNLDRPKTKLRLDENSTYSVYTDRDQFEIVDPPSNHSIKIELAYSNGIAFRTLEPGSVTLTFIDKETEKKQYLVEVTILGDTRQLQAQLEKLYPEASIETIKVGDSVLLRGNVAKTENINEIIEIAEQFYPRALNQLKVANAAVGQVLPGQSQVIQGYAPVPFSRGTVSSPKPIPAPPVSTIEPQITVQAVVLEIDWGKLKETKINLENTIRAFATDPKQRGQSVQATKKSLFTPVVVPWHATDGIVQLLTTTKAVKVISRPVIRTLDGQSAEITIGEKIAISEKKEIRNGKQVLETGFHDIGTSLKLTPKLASHGGTKLSVVVEHKQRVDSPAAHIPGGSEETTIVAHKFNAVVELKVGQSAILTEFTPLSTKQKTPSVGKGLIVILAPPVIGMTSKGIEWIPETTFKWIPEKNGFVKVIRMVAKSIATKPGIDNGFSSDWHDPNSLPVPPPIRAPDYADPTPAIPAKPQDLNQSVRELRSDVRALRKDVKKLLRLLEDQASAKPTMGDIQRRIKESKTDLLVFHASWSRPCQKMASLLDEHSDRGYSIRRLNVDKNRDLVKEFGVSSVPTIIAFANGKEDERWVRSMGKDALTRIVDKYAPRQTTILKGSRQSSATSAEHRLHQALMKEVSLNSEKIPLVDVLRSLQQSEGINLFIHSRGLEEEGVELKTPVTIHVDGVTLKSALNLILEPLQLAYQVRDNTLVITSHTRAQGKKVVISYPVADLAIPIPPGGPVPFDEKALSARSSANDLDKLTKIIQTTVQPNSWDKVGGTASIRPHDSTLSLVIRQSSQAHQEIAEVLAQLRRLQDLQVTVESRFLDKLPEDFFKKLGIDFDSNKDVAKNNAKGQHPGNDPLGGIILTDRQAELLLQAAQYNNRINLIQGPKVTLFNGQATGVTHYTVGGRQHHLKHSLHMQPVISADRRDVRLNLRVSDLKSPEVETRAYVNTVPDGKTLLIEIVQPDANEAGVPMSEQGLNASKISQSTGVHGTSNRRFLLIRPRIIVQEEEEELLFPPASKLPLMLTPQGVMPEEEESLLGFE
ncbi:thioredoxin domain-containing protein [Gimesia algae]|uniref:Thioredoxin n=1 Tax=Gimesia algae TaxID=2527971 RepID=A0A517V737_9PLAN|nr:thioredoxin domain-containing protein [Gimesia algae]QDT88822.1 Thioredoxin [Gimesia algae]